MQPENQLKIEAVKEEDQLSSEQIQLLKQTVEAELATYDDVKLSLTRMYFFDCRQTALRNYTDSRVIQWFVKDAVVECPSREVLEFCRDTNRLITNHARMVIRDLLKNATVQLDLPENGWLLEHPVMSTPASVEKHVFFESISPARNLDSQISDSFPLSLTARLAGTCHEGRDFHQQFWRQKIQKAVQENRVLYAVSSKLILTLSEDIEAPACAKSVIDALPDDLVLFTSKIEARIYAQSVSQLSRGYFPVVTIVHGKPTPEPKVMCITTGWYKWEVIQCVSVRKNDCVFLGFEIFESILIRNMGILSFPKEEQFCITPFDSSELNPLHSKRQLRMIWHKKFMSSLVDPSEPTLEDMCNWLVGYCSYYLDHKEAKGAEKAKQIRELVRVVHRSYNGQDVKGFLEHIPEGHSHSLKDLINHRRDGKEKISWGWKQLTKHFIQSKAERRLLTC